MAEGWTFAYRFAAVDYAYAVGVDVDGFCPYSVWFYAGDFAGGLGRKAVSGPGVAVEVSICGLGLCWCCDSPCNEG